MVVAVQPPTLAGSPSPRPPGLPAGPGRPARRPPELLGALPCWRASRPRPRGSRRPSAPPPRGGAPGVRCLLLPSAATGLSRVLGRRSAPGSGSNCGPGVRQPFSQGRGPDRGALGRRPGTRGAQGRLGPAEAEDCACTGASTLLETPDAAA